ncbi:hypothetical protein NJT12_18900, partial [Flavobacterium sp. AC]
MSVNTLSKETELRLTEFFNQAIDPENFAKAIRRVNYLLAMSLMRECETLQIDTKSVGISVGPCHPFRLKWCHFERDYNNTKKFVQFKNLLFS